MSDGTERAAAPAPETWRAQLRRVLPSTALALAVVVLVCATVAVFGRLKHLDLSDLTRDPSAVAGEKAWVGMVSLLGFGIWGVAVGAALVGGLALPRGSARRRTLLQISALTAVLLLDDMLRLHEDVLPHVHLPEELVLGGYLVLTALWVWTNRRDLLRTEWLILLLAFGLFGGSIVVDQLPHENHTWSFVEDSFKFGGIVLWSFYLVRTAVRSVRVGATPVPGP